MSPHLSTVVALKTLSLVMGGLITYYAYRAYRRTQAPALRALAIGFGIVTLGALLAGVVDIVPLLQFSVLSEIETRDLALLIESALTTAGFGVILYSLYVE